jgi:Asp-tRNA(Asn)/Glu-tRNA(Gln) amidotransferase A subunit family amidase
MTDPIWLTAGEAAASMQVGELSAADYVEALLEQHRRVHHLNSFYYLDEERLRRDARASDERRATGSVRLLEGICVAVKDNIGVAGMPNTAGTPALRTHCPTRHAPLAQRLVDAGALIMGKAAMHELAFGVTCNNPAFRPTRNPFDQERIPGGSSGGSAAAVAAGVAPLALGTDTGGSVRIPAALCGICAMRPTVGRYPRRGIVPISKTRDTAGPMARQVADLALLDAAICGGEAKLAAADLGALRFGVPRAFFHEGLERAVAQVFEAALARLARAGVTLVEADIPGVEELNDAAGFPITLFETMPEITAYLAEHEIALTFEAPVQQTAGADVRRILMSLLGGAVSRQAYEEALAVHRPALQRAIAEYLRAHALDAFVIPTTLLAAARIGADERVEVDGIPRPTFETYIHNTCPGSIAGFPGITLPAGETQDALPVGLGLEGAPGADRRLLEIGLAMEGVLLRVRHPWDPHLS